MLVNGTEVSPPFPTVKLPDIPKAGTSRRKPISHVVLHTTGGYPDTAHPTPQQLRPGSGDAKACHARDVHAYWSKGSRVAGAHILIDADGTVYQIADLATRAMYHAVGFNQVSIGIEVVQQRDSSLYDVQLFELVKVCAWLSGHFGLAKTVAMPYTGVRDSVEGIDFIGHRDVSSNRGFGDPGDFVMQALVDAGWVAL